MNQGTFLIAALVGLSYYAITMFAPKPTPPNPTEKKLEASIDGITDAMKRSRALWVKGGYIICDSKHGIIDSEGNLHCK